MATVDIPTVEVQLGTQVFELQPMPVGRAKRWREQFTTQLLHPSIELLTDNKELLTRLTTNAGKQSASQLAQQELAPLAPVVSQVAHVLHTGLDAVVDLIIAHPTFAAEADYILDNATTSQCIVALTKIVTLEYPFGHIADMLRVSVQQNNASKN